MSKLHRVLTALGSTRSRMNERGNAVHNYWADCDRYIFDFKLCTTEEGWRQYDTSQDAHYFGVWVNPQERLILTYAEGGISLVNCGDAESFKAELAHMAEFYGDPPPAFIAIGSDGAVAEFYDERPTGAEAAS